MARFEDTFVSLVDDARIVYCHSEEDKIRYLELKQKVQEMNQYHSIREFETAFFIK